MPLKAGMEGLQMCVPLPAREDARPAPQAVFTTVVVRGGSSAAPGPVLHGGGGLCESGVLIDGPGRGYARRVVGDPPRAPGPWAGGGGGGPDWVTLPWVTRSPGSRGSIQGLFAAPGRRN